MNNQPPEPVLTRAFGSHLDVHSVFLTVQGEGPFSGCRAVFVRLAGCNLQCPGCDTEYTRGRRTRDISSILLTIKDKWFGCVEHVGRPLVVITGGEPLRQPIGVLVGELLGRGMAVQIESNGTCPPDEKLEEHLAHVEHHRLCLVVSPKTPNLHPRVIPHIAAYKYVLDARSTDPDDGLPVRALELDGGNRVARPARGVRVYVTPYDDHSDPHATAINVMLVGQIAIKHGYMAGLQIHKLMDLQ